MDKRLDKEEFTEIWRLAEEVGEIGYWEWDLQTNETYWSEQKKKIYGLERMEEGSFETFLSVIDEETRQLVEQEIAQVLAGGKEFYDLQHRIFLRNGREVWVHEKGYLLYDENGEPRKMVGVVLDVTERKRLEKDLVFQRSKSSYFENFDPLTRLPNRHAFYRQLEQAISETGHFVLIMIDLEDFGSINNIFGHRFGDRVLARLARKLEELAGRGNTYRYGADEFVLLIRDLQDTEGLLSRLRHHLFDLPLQVEDQSVTLRFNAGVIHFPEDARTLTDLISGAGTALTYAKSQPHSRIIRFQPYMQERISRTYHGVDALYQAIEQRAFVPYYQPIIDLSGGKVLGVEAMARWIGPDGHPISEPDRFLPLAREHRLIHRIDYQIIEQALKDFSKWRNAGLDIRLSVNVYLDDFSRAGFSALFRRYQPKLKHLIVEVSEQEFLTCSKAEREQLEILRNLGIQISIDDFGTGYSSLRYLHALPIDEIKIDRSFIEDLPEDPQSKDLVHVIKNIAEIYGLQCVVEGVEREDQSRFLASIGLPRQQGFLFARPMDAEACTRYLENNC